MSAARDAYVRRLSTAWRGNRGFQNPGCDADPGVLDPTDDDPVQGLAQQPDPAPPEMSPAEVREMPYQAAKRALGMMWMKGYQPHYWDRPPVDPLTAVLMPAEYAGNKGSGTDLTEQYIEMIRAQQRAAFAERMTQAYKFRHFHL